MPIAIFPRTSPSRSAISRDELLLETREPPRVVENDLPRAGEAHAAPLRHDEPRAELLLELPEPDAERGLRHEMRLGGGREASELGDGDEIFERRQIHKHIFILFIRIIK